MDSNGDMATSILLFSVSICWCGWNRPPLPLLCSDCQACDCRSGSTTGGCSSPPLPRKQLNGLGVCMSIQWSCMHEVGSFIGLSNVWQPVARITAQAGWQGARGRVHSQEERWYTGTYHSLPFPQAFPLWQRKHGILQFSCNLSNKMKPEGG